MLGKNQKQNKPVEKKQDNGQKNATKKIELKIEPIKVRLKKYGRDDPVSGMF